MISHLAEPVPRHICVVLLSGLGDVIHGLPVVNALRDSIDGLRITWVVEPMPAGILEKHPSIDRVVVFRKSEGLGGLRKLRRELSEAGPFDATMNFNVYLKSIWPVLLSRSSRRIGFDRARTFEGVWLASNDRIPAKPVAHTADMFLEFAAHLGVAVPDPAWRITFSELEDEEMRHYFRQFEGQPVVTVIPASASHKKDWITSRWKELVDALAGDFGFRVVIAGGPGEREQAIGREILDTASHKPGLAMGDSVRRLAGIIAESSLVIAPDTGPVHIARALGVPVIGLYGHTNPWRVGPWNACQDLWIDHYTNGDPDPSNRTPRWDVMPGITTVEVLTKVQLAVERYGVGRKRPAANR
ncbi:MAG: glycosyltransferase family 9 protein [Gemmatimonadaceae bacterium]